MASEDVIELGSSEDEAEPAPKKKKPMPNAMVHIPSKLPGLTIKPATKMNMPPAQKILNFPRTGNEYSQKKMNIPKGMLSKPILIGKINGPVLNKLPKVITRAPSNPPRFSINPINVSKNLKKSELVIKKITSKKRNPVEIQGPRLLNKLPPGITIKPLAGMSGINKKQRGNPLKRTIGEVLTVEIDDEEANETSNEGPQWYLRPEEQADFKNDTKDCQEPSGIDKNDVSMEEQNNREPEPSGYVEITIEDSPVKPLLLRDNSEIGKEFAITIEDSPIKPIKNTKVDSDREQSPERVPQSKKKLDYPKEREVVEIEIDLMDTGSFYNNDNKDSTKVSTESNNGESKKPSEESHTSKHESNDTNDSKNDSGNHKFHKIYQNFIDTCFKLENSEDMKKIVDKKIIAYYKQCPKEYVESEDFIDIVSSKIVAMNAAPQKMYLYIKDIVDDLNVQRKMSKAKPTEATETSEETGKAAYVDDEYDSKRQRQIRKLEKTIKKLHRAIQKLEEQEVDFEDDEDSVYLLTERYKERMVHVHAKFCQLTNTKMPSEPRLHLEVRPGRPAGPVRKLEKWINRKVPIGAPLPFPDFHDVLRCVREANNEDKLGWNEVDIMEEARDLFTRCGKKLQRRRQENEWRLAISRIPHDVDPAEESVDLKKKLDTNKSEASKREAELLNKYVDRQNQLKLVPEEIGDKEAEESPVESEEDEIDEENPLINKQKRKERLKRLLQERSKKVEEKENNPEEKIQDNNDDDNKIKSSKLELEKKYQEDDLNKTVSTDNDAQKRHEEDNIKSNVNDERKENVQEVEKDNQNEIDESMNNDENEFESDIDELHLLQKLHSENESDVSTLDSSDSDSPIAISDSLESDSDVENKNPASDVISIENSSYSESESNVDAIPKQDVVNYSEKSKVEELVSNAFEIEYSTDSIRRTESEHVDENILLASSDDENSNKVVEFENTFINLKDDDISISETTIDENRTIHLNEKDSLENSNASVLFENESQCDQIHEQNIVVRNIDEQDNRSVDSVIECSETDEVIHSSNLFKDDTDIRSISDANSVNSLELQMEPNKVEMNSSQTQSFNNIKSCINKQSDKSEIQSLRPTEGSTTNTETVNNNMETD